MSQRGIFARVDLFIIGATLREFLKKNSYYASYDWETRHISFKGDNEHGMALLMSFGPVDYVLAVKFAEELGLNGDSGGNSWSKWNPSLTIVSDGSAEAETLRAEAVRLGIPYTVREGKSLELVCGVGRHILDNGWTLEKMMGIVREMAERYKEQLATTP